MVTVRKNEEASRYEAEADGRPAGFADYRVRGDVVVFPHTVVPGEFQGQGIAGQIVQYAMDDVRAAGLKVDAQCWYVDGWLKRHPDYADLRA